LKKIVTDDDILEIEHPTDERRQFERRNLNVEIQFNGGDARGIATTRDVALGGLYMATAADLREGTLLSMRLFLGDKELILSGVVTYRDPGHGVGVRFHNLSPAAEAVLRRELPLT
jgi:hypothetical protein